MFTKIDSSVKKYVCRTGRTNQSLPIRCKDTQFFSFTQINAKKNMILCHTTYKNFAPRFGIYCFCGAKVQQFCDIREVLFTSFRIT